VSDHHERRALALERVKSRFEDPKSLGAIHARELLPPSARSALLLGICEYEAVSAPADLVDAIGAVIGEDVDAALIVPHVSPPRERAMLSDSDQPYEIV
jgi:hypothetical protein